MSIRHSIPDLRPLVGMFPRCGPVRVKYGTEGKLPCVSGIDNSAPFSKLPYAERMSIMLNARRNAPTEAPRPPRRHRIGGKFATKSQAIISDLLGYESSEAHLSAVNSSKAAKAMYEE